MARGCQYYCPQGGEVVANYRIALPSRHGWRNPVWAGEIIKCEIWESWCFAPRWLAVRQVLLTSHRLTSRRSCIKHTRVRNLHRKHRLFRREQLRYPAFKIKSEPMTVWLPPPLLSSSGRPRSLSVATNRQPLNSPR